jgi:hypothetical protein
VEEGLAGGGLGVKEGQHRRGGLLHLRPAFGRERAQVGEAFQAVPQGGEGSKGFHAGSFAAIIPAAGPAV